VGKTTRFFTPVHLDAYLQRNRRAALEPSIFTPSPPHTTCLPSVVLSHANQGV
jgi:hypothetical protein